LNAKRNLVWWTGLPMLLVLSAVLFWALWPRVSNPVSRGKRLSYWFTQLPAIATFVGTNARTSEMEVTWTSVSNSLSGGPKRIHSLMSSVPTIIIDSNWPFANFVPATERQEDTLGAIQEMGTNAVPFLMMKLRTKDSLFKQQMQKWARKLGVKSPLFESAIVQRGRAASGLFTARLSRDVRKELEGLSTNADPNLASLARTIVRHNNALASSDTK
jgi:hypothetical protein